MSTARFATVIGLAIGALWALAGLPGALVGGLGALMGFLVGQVLGGGIDLSEIQETVQETRRRRRPASTSTERRTRWPIQ